MTTRARVAINGFGRIGRNALRAALGRADADAAAGIEIVAINDVNDPAMLAYLLEFDTVHGHLPASIELVGDVLRVGDRRVRMSSDRDPSQLPWQELGIDVVIESTGHFTVRHDAACHLEAGAGRVIISAPATGADITICMGVNEDRFDPARHTIISNASCTTNCLAPMAHVLHRRFGIESGFMTTIHAYTNDQKLVDLPHRGHTRDLRRARAAAQNIVPSTTGAALAIGDVIPELRDRFAGIAVRVPVPDGSLTDLVCTLSSPATVDDVNRAFDDAAREERMRGVLEVTHRPLVSSDILGNSHSCVLSACDTMALGGHVKVLAWYDNEWAYANRLLDLVAHIETERSALTQSRARRVGERAMKRGSGDDYVAPPFQPRSRDWYTSS